MTGPAIVSVPTVRQLLVSERSLTRRRTSAQATRRWRPAGSPEGAFTETCTRSALPRFSAVTLKRPAWRVRTEFSRRTASDAVVARARRRPVFRTVTDPCSRPDERRTDPRCTTRSGAAEAAAARACPSGLRPPLSRAAAPAATTPMPIAAVSTSPTSHAGARATTGRTPRPLLTPGILPDPCGRVAVPCRCPAHRQLFFHESERDRARHMHVYQHRRARGAGPPRRSAGVSRSAHAGSARTSCSMSVVTYTSADWRIRRQSTNSLQRSTSRNA